MSSLRFNNNNNKYPNQIKDLDLRARESSRKLKNPKKLSQLQGRRYRRPKQKRLSLRKIKGKTKKPLRPINKKITTRLVSKLK